VIHRPRWTRGLAIPSGGGMAGPVDTKASISTDRKGEQAVNGRIARWATLACFGTAAAVAWSLAQAPAPKYYAGTVAPNPSVTGTYQAPPAPLRASAPALPAAVPTAPPSTPSKSRFFNPTGSDAAVRPASASELEQPKAESTKLPSPAIDAVPTSPSLVPLPPLGGEPKLPAPSTPTGPNVTAERVPSIPPLGSPAKNLPEPPLPAPPGSDVPAPLEAPKMPAPTSAIPSTGNLSSKNAPNVSVEYEMPDSVGVGQPLSYVLVVRNLGTTAVSNVRVDQDTPPGCQYQSSEPAAETNGDGKLAWLVGAMDGGAETRIKVTVKPTDEGEIRGRASVSFSASVEGKAKVTRPKIGVALSAPETARVGEKVAITIKLTNTGSGAANALTLQARLTDGLTHSAGAVIEAPLANLAAGASITRTLEVSAAKPGAQQVTLAVFADTNAAETAKANITLVEPQLTMKQTGPAKCLVKAEPTYSIELGNPGTTTTDPVSLWTMVPDGFEFVQASDGGQYSATHKAVVWKLSGLGAGANKTITAKLRSIAPMEGTIRTMAQSGPAESGKTKPLEVKCETAVKAEGVPAIRFEVVDVDDPVEAGKEALYEIKITNQGTGACTNVAIVAELAEGTVAGATSGPTNAKPSGNQILFETMATLPVKGEAIYKVRVKGTQPGDTRFRVKLTSDQIKTPLVKEENTRFYKE